MAVSVSWRAAQQQVTLGVGASGAIFGLIGAFLAYGLRRGGLGADLRRTLMTWAIYPFVMGFLMGADNFAHAGGFFGGALSALALSSRRVERWLHGRLGILVELAVIGLVGFAAVQVWMG
jgi:rhomboid protease GluP